MKSKKKKIPLLVLEVIEPYLSNKSDLYRLSDSVNDNCLLQIVDTDIDSDFFFKIVSYRVEQGRLTLNIESKPANLVDVSVSTIWLETNMLAASFTKWVSFLERYSKIKSIYDDPIEKSYRDEFLFDFQIIDDDADLVSFDLKQQLWLDGYLDNFCKAIDSYADTNEEKKQELLELKENVIELKSNLTVLTKKKIIESLAWAWAKARKIGLPILKHVLIDFQSELVSMIFKKMIE